MEQKFYCYLIVTIGKHDKVRYRRLLKGCRTLTALCGGTVVDKRDTQVRPPYVRQEGDLFCKLDLHFQITHPVVGYNVIQCFAGWCDLQGVDLQVLSLERLPEHTTAVLAS